MSAGRWSKRKIGIISGVLLLNVFFFQNCSILKTALFVSSPEKAYAMAVGSQPGADTGGPHEDDGDGGGGTDGNGSNGGNYSASDVSAVTGFAQQDVGRALDANEKPNLGTPR